jgi:hypothetical protein|tara:strand:+ start:1146 stop:1292 length:147 start_codon:yes stop_codon:yes gene_type:complete
MLVALFIKIASIIQHLGRKSTWEARLDWSYFAMVLLLVLVLLLGDGGR